MYSISRNKVRTVSMQIGKALPTAMRGMRFERGLGWVLGGLVLASMVMVTAQIGGSADLRMGPFTIDRLGAIFSLLVVGIGWICYRFAWRYLDGEAGHERFLRWLWGTIIAAYLFMLSSNLLVLLLVWAGMSMGLHQLLTFYRERAQVWRPAQKKFIISRIGDLALLAAIWQIWQVSGSLDLHLFLQALPAQPAAATPIALLIAIAALTKSAQFPFHSWLPETMEAPTPVSALMHAGIINAGGVLLLRFSPLIASVPEALLLLSVIGTITLSLGMLSMWAQPDIKRRLAWSTVGQMGFMMVQCGLAAFPMAVLHILGHSCYKAWAFLRSGSLPSERTAAPLAPQQQQALFATGVVCMVPTLAAASLLTGFDPLHSPGELALSAMLALAGGIAWAAAPFRSSAPIQRSLLRVGLTFLGSIAAFLLYQGSSLLFGPALAPLPQSFGMLHWIAALLPLLAVSGLSLLAIWLPIVRQQASGRKLMVAAMHGFYIGLLMNRMIERMWKHGLQKNGSVTNG